MRLTPKYTVTLTVEQDGKAISHRRTAATLDELTTTINQLLDALYDKRNQKRDATRA